MVNFGLNSEFDITVNHPKEDAFDKFLSHVNESKQFNLTDSKRSDTLYFRRKTSGWSLPIDFTINFESIDENHTKLMVKSQSGTIDWGKAKGMINDIVKKIY